MTVPESSSQLNFLAHLPELYALATLDEYPKKALDFMARAIRVDSLTYRETMASNKLVRFGHWPDEVVPAGGLVGSADTQALAAKAGLSWLALRQSLARHRNIVSASGPALSLALPIAQDALIQITLLREQGEFSEEERALVDLASPHLLMAYRNARRVGRIKRYIERRRQRDLAKQHIRRAPEASLMALGLSPREVEVLSWVVKGKTSWETGHILNLSPRTIQKHLQHIYEKLGVETRTGAIVLVMNMAQVQAPEPPPPHFPPVG